MARRLLRSIRPARNADRTWNTSLLAIEPLEDRTLLAVDLQINTGDFAAATPFKAEQLSRLDLSPFQSLGRVVPVFSGEWVVRLGAGGDDGSLADSLATAKAVLGAHVKGLQSVRGLASTDTFLIHTSSDYSLADISEALANIAGFSSVEPNFLAWMDDTIPNDTSFADQWAHQNTGQLGGLIDADIDSPLAWDVNTGSGKTVVGVVDSGVNYNHPDLNDNMWHNPGEIPGDAIDNDHNGFVDDVFGYDFLNGDSDPLDDAGHGTAVAGIIAAEGNNALGVAGVNWDAQIMALKIFDPFGFAGTAQIVAAINYATMMKQDYGVDLIATNHSWGTVGFSTVLYDAIAASGAADILFVTSAGNSQHDNDVAPQYPAGYDLANIISVAATDRLDNRASFTSFGATTVDLGAPGVSTLTTNIGGGYANFSGTSASSPYVAGVAALVHDTYPKATALEVKQAILNGVDHIASMAGITVTGGRLNANGALRAMQMQVVAATPDAGDVVTTAPLHFTIKTAYAITPGTIHAGDLTVNGIAANSVTVDNPKTLTFKFTTSPVTTQGLQEVRIVAGAFTRQFDSNPVKAFVAPFRYDALRLAAIATTPSSGAIVPWPVNSIRIDFNETVGVGSVDLGDLELSEGNVSGFNVIDSNTIEYQLAGIESDRRLTVGIPAGALADPFGNPNLAFTTTLDVDASAVGAAPFERLEPLGGMIFASHGDGRLTGAADVDHFDFFVEAGQTVAARVTPLDQAANILVQFLGLTALVGSPAAGQPAILGPTPVNSDGVVSLKISGDRATDYRVEIFKNAAIETPAGATPQNISNSGITLGSRRYGVVGRIDSAGQTDRYAVDLSAAVGQKVDIVLAGQDGVSLAGATLELVAPNGTIVTATADPLGNGATNYDLAILGFVPNQGGNYQLRLTSNVLGRYGMVVTERLLFESEVNDGPLGSIRSLDGVLSVAGFINPFGQTGPFEFVVDTTLSTLVLSGGIGAPGQPIAVPLLPQAPGSLESNLHGVVRAVVSTGSIQLLPEAAVFPFVKPGPFQPGNAPADFAASLNAPPIIVGGAIALRDTAWGMTVDSVPIDANGNFPSDALSFVVRETLAASIPGVISTTQQVDDSFIDNEATTPASLKFIGGRLELTLPIKVRALFPVPQLPLAGIFDVNGQIVARAIVPGTEDVYSITVAPGKTIGIETRTPFDDAASTPGNSLDPAIQLLDSNGAVVASDTNSAGDGKNARLQFTSPNGGTYRVRVLQTSGQGEYVLSVATNLAPVLDAIGNKAIGENSKLMFTAHASDVNLDQLTYSLGPGAPAGASIHPTSGLFTWTPPDNTGSPFAITVIATDNGSPQMSDSETILVTVANIAPVIQSATIGPAAAKEGDLVTLTVKYSDVSILDTHTAVVHWGDGTSSPAAVTKMGGSGKFVASHRFSYGGIFNVSFAVTDDDGGAATGAKTQLVAGVGIHERGDQTVLEIVGTGGHDSITVTPLRNGKLYVFASFLPGLGRTVPLAGLELIEVLGLGGNDFIGLGTIFGAVTLPALVDGGDGNDTITGGNGGNVIMGGRGNDVMFGGTLRDILIGGEGADSVYGNAGEDILIAGYTSYDTGGVDNKLTNDVALLDLLKEWRSTRSYSQRTANIVNGTGPILGPSGRSLKKGLTVFDDNQSDWLSGAAGLDWYFYDFRDVVIGKTAGEKVNS